MLSQPRLDAPTWRQVLNYQFSWGNRSNPLLTLAAAENGFLMGIGHFFLTTGCNGPFDRLRAADPDVRLLGK